MDVCECCGGRGGQWWCLDENVETMLCRQCAMDLNDSGEVDIERILT